MLGLWIAALLALAVGLERHSGALGIGDPEALLPTEHRRATDEPQALLRFVYAQGTPDSAPSASLLEAARRVADHLGGERIPLLPPRGEANAWLDAHALYLVAVDEHDQLAAKLSDEAVSSAVQDLKARLSSPLFGVSGEDPRRDPLGLRGLAQPTRGGLGFIRPGAVGARNLPVATAAGDLLSAGGDSLLIQLRSERPLAALRADLREAVGDLPVRVDLLGPRARAEASTLEIASHAPKVALGTLAGLALVLALSLRRARPVLAILACVCFATATLALSLALLGLGLSLLTLPLALCLAAFGCEPALRLQPLSRRGWAATMVIATALLPLQLSPYPLWRDWAWIWAIAYLGVALAMRLILPSVLGALGGPKPWNRRDFLLRPMPLMSLLLCSGLGFGGAWAGSQLAVRGAASLPTVDSPLRDAEQHARAEHYDARRIVEISSEGDTPVEALETAASHVEILSAWLPTEANLIDSPGGFVLTPRVLELRRASLSELGLRQRMRELHSTLESQGFRADAFAEFLRGSADIDSNPDAATALAGPLGPWIEGYLEPGPTQDLDDEPTWTLRSRVLLRPRVPGTRLSALHDLDGAPIIPRGPAIAEREDAEVFIDGLGLQIVCGLWLGALFVWLGTRTLAIAVASAFAALSAVSGVLLTMALLHIPAGPHLLPAILLVVAACVVASGRSCWAVKLGTPLVASAILVAGLCQICAGLALLASPQPLWREVGLVIAVGCALASGLGLFVAPGMARFLARFPRRISGAKRDPQ